MPARLIMTTFSIRSRKLAALVAMGLLASLASAQAQAPAQAVDETALRYYIAHDQVQRAEAEAKRLTALHPGWTMPKDIWTVRTNQADETAFWELFSAGDNEGLARAIAGRRILEPGWQPSDDLAGKIRQRELRAVILAKGASAQWEEIAGLATGYEKTGDMDDAELAWLMAEGLARSGRQPEALAIYTVILNRREDPKERSATIQKALGLLPISDVDTLLKLGRVGLDGTSEFADLAIDVTRARISAVLHDEIGALIDAAELTRFEAFARTSPDAGDPGLLAWLALKQGRNSEALTWFELSLSHGGDAMIAHGLATTLRRLNMTRETEEVAFAWREPLANNVILYIDVLEAELTKPVPPVIETDRLARYAKVTLEMRSGEGAQALAWYAYNSCQFETALGWFQRASAWFPKEGTIYGQALSLQRLKRQKEFIELVNRYDGLFPRVVALLFASEDNPTPCDVQPVKAVPRPADQAGLQNMLQSTRVPQPNAIASANVFAFGIKRSDFPIAVSPENPARFPDQGTVKSPGDVWRPRSQESAPLVARRVGGVTAMPYERFGYTLLPGWNGATEPSDTPEVDRLPARGTLWAQEFSTQTGITGAGFAYPGASGNNSSAAQRFKR